MQRNILKYTVTSKILLDAIEQLLQRFSKNVYNFDPVFQFKDIAQCMKKLHSQVYLSPKQHRDYQ